MVSLNAVVDEAPWGTASADATEKSRLPVRRYVPAVVVVASLLGAVTQFLAFPRESGTASFPDLVGEGVVVLVLVAGLFVVHRVEETRVYRPLMAGVAVFYVFALADFLDEFTAQPEWFALVFESGAEAVGAVLLVLGLARWTVARRERAAELQRRSEQLEVLNRILRHDIRNDTMVIRGWASVVQKETGPDADERLDRIVAASNSIIDLTENAKEFTDVLTTTDVVELEPRPLASTVGGELEKVRARYENATVTVEGSLPDVDVVAHSMLPALFRNLLVNAVEHNDAAVPEVRVSAVRSGDTVEVHIADNGPGIPDDRKDRVFGKGETVAESSRAGFGLYLVGSLVEQFGGDVRVEDAEGGGAVFVVVLRVADDAAGTGFDTDDQ